MKKTTQESGAAGEEDLVTVARVVKTRGIRGELVTDPLTDFPGRFARLDSLTAVWPDGHREQLRIEDHWFHRGRIVFKFSGYDSIEAAKSLVGCALAVEERERIELPESHFYEWELAGCQVKTVGGEFLGQVREVMRTGGVELLVVESDRGRDILIPMVRDICTEIDIAGKLIRVDPPEGLLEL